MTTIKALEVARVKEEFEIVANLGHKADIESAMLVVQSAIEQALQSERAMNAKYEKALLRIANRQFITCDGPQIAAQALGKRILAAYSKHKEQTK